MLGMKLEQTHVRAMRRGDDSVWQLLADEAWKLSVEDHKASHFLLQVHAREDKQPARDRVTKEQKRARAE